MGGFGSGRRSGGGTTIEACRSLDINSLRKAGVLSATWCGIWYWTCDGEPTASISIRGGRNRIVLSYRWRRDDTDWKDIDSVINVHWADCRFGGERPYFRCPGVVNRKVCGRNVLKLHCAGRYYLCRHCYGLTYTSQSEDRWDRALRRANKIRRRLGGESGAASVFPSRPKGMWRKTYERLRSDAFEAEMEAEDRLAFFAARLMKSNHGKRGYWK